VVLGDPARVVVLARGDGGGANGLGAGEGGVGVGCLLGLLGGLGALGLREEGLNPGLVDEEEGAGEGSGEEQVEEDAAPEELAINVTVKVFVWRAE
jgi:hypothetical protein